MCLGEMNCLTDRGLLEGWDLRQLSAEPDTHLSAQVSRLKFHDQISNAALRSKRSKTEKSPGCIHLLFFFSLGGRVRVLWVIENLRGICSKLFVYKSLK